MEILIPGACVPKGRPRVTFQHGRAFAYTPARTRDYAAFARAYAVDQCNKENWKPIPKDKPVRILMEFILKRKITAVPDLLNLGNQILDAITGVCYENDSQVVEVLARKIRGEFPMTRIVVEEYR